ncbi:MAG: hypothetical protein ABWY20_03225 [Mycobacterium sp.]
MTTVNFEPGSTFSRTPLLTLPPRNLEEERLALRYLDRMAPDLVGVVMGGVL